LARRRLGCAPAGLTGVRPAATAGPQRAGADRPSLPRRLAADHRHGIADPVVVVGSALVVVSVVVVGAAVVVGSVVGGAAVVLGPVTGAWVLVTPKIENPSLVAVVPAVACAWALTDPAVVVDPLTVRGTASGVVVVRVGAVVGSWGTVVGVDAGLAAGWAGAIGSARAGARRGGGGWGSRVAEVTTAAKTAVVSPKATNSSRQGYRDLARCRGGGVDMGHGPGSTASSRPPRPTP
jgi:hypothetical protein